MMENSSNEDVQPRAIIYVRQEVLEKVGLTEVCQLADTNMVTVEIKEMQIANIFNRMADSTKPPGNFIEAFNTKKNTLWVVERIIILTILIGKVGSLPQHSSGTFFEIVSGLG